MSAWEAVIKFAALVSVDRADAFRFKPGQSSIPLLADHDPACELGRIRSWFALRWLDGEWIAATAELHSPPPPFLQRGARASYRCRPLWRYAVLPGRPEGQVVGDALLEEVTVVTSLFEPCEPLAEVLSVREVASAQPLVRRRPSEPEGEVILGGPPIYRPNIGRVTAVGR
jgi:hypothetical protein